MKAIKLWIAVNARDARLDAVAEMAAQHDLPIFFHAWYKSFDPGKERRLKELAAGSESYSESNGSDIAHLASRHPETSIVMLHLPGVRQRGVLDIAPYPNVCIDTSGGQPVAGLVEYAVEKLGAERVLYGSDYYCRSFATQLGRVWDADISDDQKAAILWRNSCRILKV